MKVSKREIDLYKKISGLDQLSTILQCHEGIHTGNSRDILFFQEKKGDSFKKLFHGARAGDQIQNYKSKTSGWYVDYRKEVYKNVKGKYASLRDERIFKYPKIYITRTGNPITAFYDKDTYASNNFFSLQFKDYSKNNEERLKTILPLILSKFSNYYIRTFAAPRLGDTYVETKIFHILKIPYKESMIDNPILKQLTDIMIFKISRDEEYGVFQKVVDALILNFFFSKEIELLSIDIKEDLNKDLSSCIEESDFDGLSIQKKEKAVEILQARWSDPDNEVRKRINSFPEKSPDILKPILEG